MPVRAAGNTHPEGRVASLPIDSLTHVTGTSAAEGTSQLTYTVERTGLYRISSVLVVKTAGTGAGQVANVQAAYNNGAAQAASTLKQSGVTPGTLDVTAAAGTHLNQSQTVYAIAGTSIVVSILGAGTFTLAAILNGAINIDAV
jgi:hypothetical protein